MIKVLAIIECIHLEYSHFSSSSITFFGANAKSKSGSESAEFVISDTPFFMSTILSSSVVFLFLFCKYFCLFFLALILYDVDKTFLTVFENKGDVKNIL